MSPDELLLQATRAWNIAVRERPQDEELWLDFAAFQHSAAQQQQQRGRCGTPLLSTAPHAAAPVPVWVVYENPSAFAVKHTTVFHRATFSALVELRCVCLCLYCRAASTGLLDPVTAEKQISLLSKGLAHHPCSNQLLLALLRCYAAVAPDADSLEAKWAGVLARQAGSWELWREYIALRWVGGCWVTACVSANSLSSGSWYCRKACALLSATSLWPLQAYGQLSTPESTFYQHTLTCLVLCALPCPAL